jgi:hypothetical protein
MANGIMERPSSLSGLTEPEAKEFHAIFLTSFIIFTAIAVVEGEKRDEGAPGIEQKPDLVHGASPQPIIDTRPWAALVAPRFN